ncbi:MAG TPA: hypothetical protein VMT52_10470 [Planctomycetota bacterium]|nr:hypothetical protein [Planctomycetota bacterium]
MTRSRIEAKPEERTGTDIGGKASDAGAAERNRNITPSPSVAFWLSFLLPGMGHLYLGRWKRALLWSLAFLGLVVPAGVFGFILWPWPGISSYFYVSLAVALFLVACGTGPARTAIRIRRGEDQGPSPRRAATWVLESYAAILILGATFEVQWLVAMSIGRARVHTERLAPLYARGDEAVVVLSRFVRPVHGDVILLKGVGVKDVGPGAAPERTLGRVLAKEGDTLWAGDGKLVVNGVELQLARTDQRRAIERAGRGQRVRRAIHVPFLAPPEPKIGSEAWKVGVSWGAGEWGPFYLPADSFLVLLDAEEGGSGAPRVSAPGSEGRGAPRPSRAVLVHKGDIAGRVIR